MEQKRSDETVSDKLLLQRGVKAGVQAMRNGYFEDAAKLQKTAKQMKKLSEDIAKFKEEVEDIKEKSRRARKRMEDTWTPPMSAENLPPRYENERCLFYGTTEVISTYSKASQSIAECLKVLQDVKLMSGRLEVQTLNGVKHLKRTIKSMEVAEEIIDDAMNSNYFDHTV